MRLFFCSLFWCRVKLISAGKVITSHQILSEQNLQNNQQILAVILESSNSQAENAAESAAYDRVQKAREDAQLLIKQKRHEFMQVSVEFDQFRTTERCSIVVSYLRRWKIRRAMQFICRHMNGLA